MINIKSIWESQKPTNNDVLLKIKIEAITHLNCYVAVNNITGQFLYLMSFNRETIIPQLKNYRFKGVEIFTMINETTNEVDLYILLLENELKDIFYLFIQNILEEIEEMSSEQEVVNSTFNIIYRWKKLFDKIKFNGLSIQQQKGLIGELLFFNYLLDNNKSSERVLNAWTGPDFEDKDFTFGSIGVEIKLTSSKYPRIQITNERQLDVENFRALYLILYTVEEVKENGVSLNLLIERIRQKLATDIELNFFNQRLMLLGYKEEDKEHCLYTI